MSGDDIKTKKANKAHNGGTIGRAPFGYLNVTRSTSVHIRPSVRGARPARGAECTVEVLPDGGRVRQLVVVDIGPVLHPDDVAADKGAHLVGPSPTARLSSTPDARRPTPDAA
jgi:hypothetical protein